MGFRLRSATGEARLSGDWIDGGTSTRLSPDEIRPAPLAETEVAGRRVPTRWRVEAPGRGVELEIAALNHEAWNGAGVGHREGPAATADGATIRFLEMRGIEARRRLRRHRPAASGGPRGYASA